VLYFHQPRAFKNAKTESKFAFFKKCKKRIKNCIFLKNAKNESKFAFFLYYKFSFGTFPFCVLQFAQFSLAGGLVFFKSWVISFF